MKKTKIVCTIGPASQDKEVLTSLIKAGMNVMRLNFSHGDHEEHLAKVKTLKEIENGTAKRIKQGEDFSLAPMLDKSIAKIDWENKTAREIKNLVRGLNPIMGAYSFINGKKVKFWKVDVLDDKEIDTENKENLENGTVLISDAKQGLFIKAKDGILKVLEIQGENAKKMDIASFLRGNKIEKFDIFK